MATVGINFGRYNPPHIGHVTMWRKMIDECSFKFVGFNPNTVNDDNPLPPEEKTAVISTLEPKIANYIYHASTLLVLASQVYDTMKVLKSVTTETLDLRVYTDEQWLVTALILYNGHENMHGYFDFDSIVQVPTERITSSTAVKDAVKNNDRDAFTQASGFDADMLIRINTKDIKFFDLVREHMKT